ncbi:hypothetical protein N9517_01405 [Candidatus Pelagibacter sp.]|jgi:hypothetical protein|nr:hypothetical protein [Candidatus Pelagibacter sp.]|tara:strand:- start:988 stop:1212 length:225 start_codon:yes stop_codon:yes gene_type:complete
MIRIFDNNKSKSESKGQKKNIPAQYIDQKRIVDINKLLNRVKINQRREAIKKITFYSLTIFSLSLALILIINIK